MLALLEVIERVADSPAPVLIEGESGTGKELLARALHERSRRSRRAFVPINCAAIPDSLMESQLFGYEKGAFTSATERYGGLLAQADGGSVFLDEVGEFPSPMQAKLLRFLQSQELQRLSSRETVRVDARVVAATSRRLTDLVAAGEFQEALYYRLNVVPLTPPPLREREGDIPLENLVHRLVALAGDEVLRVAELPAEVLGLDRGRLDLGPETLSGTLEAPLLDLDDLRRRREVIDRVLAEKERELAERVVREAGGNHTEAARQLGIHRTTLYKILKPATG